MIGQRLRISRAMVEAMQHPRTERAIAAQGLTGDKYADVCAFLDRFRWVDTAATLTVPAPGDEDYAERMDLLDKLGRWMRVAHQHVPHNWSPKRTRDALRRRADLIDEIVGRDAVSRLGELVT